MIRVSVCIATYNGEKFITTQLNSILSQLGENDEVVISDDSSSDRTVEIIQSYNDSRIKVLSGKKFQSLIFNFENALKHATGDVIFLSDQDDVWVANKVKTMLDALQDADLVVSNAIIGDELLQTIKDSYFEWRNSRAGILKNILKNSYLGCCMAFNRKILDFALPFPKNIPMHDMWLGMIAELYFKPVFIQDKLMIYRRHGDNATFLNKNYTSNESFLSKLTFRYNLLISMVKRFIKIKYMIL